MSSSFGKWYDERKAEESGENNLQGGGSSSGNWFGGDSDQLLPLFNTESLQSLSWSNMKASMEAQMPKKIMGMGYQERFQVRWTIKEDCAHDLQSSIFLTEKSCILFSRLPLDRKTKVFCGLLFVSALFFFLAFSVGIPTLAMHPHKFALSFTMGSFTFMASFGVLKGPMEHLKSMFQLERIYFTSIYLGSMFLTIYCTFSFGGLTGYFLVIASSATQLMALLWYLISFLPGGAAGLHYLATAMGHILRPVMVACTRMQAVCIAKCVTWLASANSSS